MLCLRKFHAHLCIFLFFSVGCRSDITQDTLERLALAYLAERRQTRNRIIAVAAHIQIIGLFVPTAIAALSPLDCTIQPSGEVTLDASPDMMCSAEEEGYTLLALLAPVLFCCFAVLPIFAIVYKLYGEYKFFSEFFLQNYPHQILTFTNSNFYKSRLTTTFGLHEYGVWHGRAVGWYRWRD